MYLDLFLSKIIVDTVKLKKILQTYCLECDNLSDIKLYDNSTQSITYGAANNSSSNLSEKEAVTSNQEEEHSDAFEMTSDVDEVFDPSIVKMVFVYYKL